MSFLSPPAAALSVRADPTSPARPRLAPAAEQGREREREAAGLSAQLRESQERLRRAQEELDRRRLHDAERAGLAEVEAGERVLAHRVEADRLRVRPRRAPVVCARPPPPPSCGRACTMLRGIYSCANTRPPAPTAAPTAAGL